MTMKARHGAPLSISVDAVGGDGRRLEADLVGLAATIDFEFAVPLILVGPGFPDHAVLRDVEGPLAFARRLVAGKIGFVLVARNHYCAQINRRVADAPVTHDDVLAVARTGVPREHHRRHERQAAHAKHDRSLAYENHGPMRPTAAVVGNTSDLITTGTAPEVS